MKKALIILLIFIVIFIVGLVLMFSFKICPPAGPWIMPPWCESQKFQPVFYDFEVKTSKLDVISSVNMFDTWGKNYNLGMFENTRNNIKSSFERVANLGAKEVYVHDFHRAVYNDEEDLTSINYNIVDEIFSNDLRDESMTQKDLNKLASIAHKNGLKIGVKHNMAFVNIGKYIFKSGNIEDSVAKDFEKFNSSHSEYWIRDFFAKWQARMSDRAKMYESAGIDIMSLTPTWMGPTFAGHEDLANQLWKELISEIRKDFSGLIHIEVDRFGFVDGKSGKEDWTKYDYYKDADIIEMRIFNIGDEYGVPNNPNAKQIKEGTDKYLDDIEAAAKSKDIKISVQFLPFSYVNGINDGIVEYLDVSNDKVKGLKKDWDHQADSWQAFFESVVGRKNIDRVVAGGFWWDDAMDPKVKARISISPSFRNKPAETVIKSWFTSY